MKLNMLTLLKRIEEELKTTVKSTAFPKQGMDNEVFFIKIENGEEFKEKLEMELTVKVGKDVLKDKLALELIHKSEINIPIPKIHKSFDFEDKHVLVMDKVADPLLNDAPDKENYIPSMILMQQKIHPIKSKSISLANDNRTWKQFLLDFYNGHNEHFDWEIISNREGVNKDLVLQTVEKIILKIENTEFISSNYSLLHTDFNQRNLFINEKTKQISGIVDWSEAMFGDPLYDFVRIRMFIWHFNLGHRAVKEYYKLLNLKSEEKELEELYMLIQVLNYINWYSEKLSDSDKERIKMHQKFLEEQEWN